MASLSYGNPKAINLGGPGLAPDETINYSDWE